MPRMLWKKCGCSNRSLVLADITLPGRNGLELIKDIQALGAWAAGPGHFDA